MPPLRRRPIRRELINRRTRQPKRPVATRPIAVASVPERIDDARLRTFDRYRAWVIATWSNSDGSYVILLDTHPAGYLDFMVPSIGRHTDGEVVKAVSLPGASKAVLDTHSYAKTHRYEKGLLPRYPQGVVQVTMNYATANTRLLASLGPTGVHV
jgi:hypothetical protein